MPPLSPTPSPPPKADIDSDHANFPENETLSAKGDASSLPASPPAPPAAAAAAAPSSPQSPHTSSNPHRSNSRKRKLVDAGHSTAEDDVPVRLSPCPAAVVSSTAAAELSMKASSSASSSFSSPSSPDSTSSANCIDDYDTPYFTAAVTATASSDGGTLVASSLSGVQCNVASADSSVAKSSLFSTNTTTSTETTPPSPPPTHQHDFDEIMTTPAPVPESAVPLDPASYLGPITNNAPSRSQSPAKRLKSEEPPNTTVETSLDDTPATPEPMDEDAKSRESSVEMVDAVPTQPETAESVDSSAGSSIAATATQPSTAPSSTATSIVPSPPPSLEEQIRMYKAASVARIEEGEIYYIISRTWVNQFIAQSHEAAIAEGIDLKQISGQELGPVDNTSIIDTETLVELERRKTEDGSVSAMDDEVLDDGFAPMKRELDPRDYDILSAEMWNSLVSWYGLAKDSPPIRRRAVNTSDNGSKNIMVEIYPPLFTVHRLRDPGQNVTQESLQTEKQLKPKKLVAAKIEGFQKFLRKVKSLTGVETQRKVRLWKVQPSSEDTANKTTKKSSPKTTTGTFKQMVLDLQTFLDLDAAKKELVNVPDQTNNPNYNGHMQIGLVGLADGATLVVEEQTSEGKWITELPTKPVNKFGELITVAKHGSTKLANTAKKKFSTTPSSPARSASPTTKSVLSKPTYFTPKKSPARPLGTCGLSNLGNTCYMNSALQCLRSVEELSKYFLSNEYEKELNPSNPLAHHGKVAKAYAGLLKNIFAPESPSSFPPREFKSTIGRFAPSFSGYQQQDSQEFLAFLLDGMHEDLNRIMTKPYTEKPDSTDEMVGNPELIAKLADRHWEIYKSRNDSAVADLFGGLYQSTLHCPECQKVSITFDPFMDLTLPLPVESFWAMDVIFFPRSKRMFPTPVKVPVEMRKNSSIGALKEYIGKKFSVDPKKIMVSEVYKTKFYKHYEDYMPVSEISSSDIIVAYELDEIPTSWPGPRKKTRSMLTFDDDDDEEPAESERILVPVFLRRPSQRRGGFGAADDWFGLPFFVTYSWGEARDFYAIIAKVVDRLQFLTTRDLYAPPPGQAAVEEEDYDAVASTSETKETSDEEKDGFVDVSMKDATSSESIEVDSEPESVSLSTGILRKAPEHIADLFTTKIVKKARGERLPTGFSTLEGDLDIMDRFEPTPVHVPRQQPQQSALFGSITAGRSGRASPVSQNSDDDDLYEVAPEPQEPQEDIMQDSEDEGAYSSTDMSAFQAPSEVPATSFYGSRPPSANGYRSPPRSPYMPPEPNPLIRLGEAMILEFTDEGWETLFDGRQVEDFRGQATWDNLPVAEDPELARRRHKREQKRSRGIHLEDCLDEFAKEEVLSAEDPWFCPRCKEHRRASKKFELWKCPDILVIHLKRFSSSRSLRDKIDAKIDCPIEGLDLSQRVGLKEDKSMLYDLIAVDNHYGGLGGGHYTASVKNWFDGKWYYCDDGSVRETDAHSVVTAAAYLLFYRRRTEHPLGGAKFEQIIASADNAKLASAPTSDVEESDVEEATGSSSSMNTGFIGPLPPLSQKLHNDVGNTTLWGNSMPVVTSSSEEDAFEDVDEGDGGGVALGPALPVAPVDEGLGDDEEEEMLNLTADGLFASTTTEQQQQQQGAQEEEAENDVDEVRV